MTNEERRAALNLARKEALEAAKVAQGAIDGDWGKFTQEYIDNHVKAARMWAHVAEAMKDGDPVHDAPDGLPLHNGILTR